MKASFRYLAAMVTAWLFVGAVSSAAVAQDPVPALSDTLEEPVDTVAAPDPEATEPGTVYRVPVSAGVELGLAPFVDRSIREAQRAGAAAVILEIETPGGRVDAAWQIAASLRDAEIPVYAYVNRHALSAGALIALATQRIFMRTGSTMGAATPVTGEGQVAPEKMLSAMRSEMRALAEAQGLDPRVAEAMVDEEIEIEGVVEAGKLLTLTASEADRIGYATEVPDWSNVLEELGLSGAEVYSTSVNWAEALVRFLTNPIVTGLLLTLGMLGLLFEVKSPGFGVGGGVGLLSLGLFFGSHYLVGLAGWEEFILISLGIALLVVELFVVPGFGVFGILGLGGILGGLYLTMVGEFSDPSTYAQAASVLGASLVIGITGGWLVLRSAPSHERLVRAGLVLGSATHSKEGYVSSTARSELIGMKGVTLTDLRPAGAARFGDERVDVVAEAGWIPRGTNVQVLRAEGYRHVVRSVDED